MLREFDKYHLRILNTNIYKYKITRYFISASVLSPVVTTISTISKMTIGSGLLLVSTIAIVLLNNAAGQGYGRPPSVDMNGGGENYGFGVGEYPHGSGGYPRHGHGGGYGYGGGYPTGHYEREMYGNNGDTYGLVGSYMNRGYRHGGYPQHYGQYSNGPYGSANQYSNGGGYNTNPGQYASGGSEYATPGRYASGDQQRYASGDQQRYASGDQQRYASGDQQRYASNGQFGSGSQSSDSMPPISHNSDSPATSFSADIAPGLAPGQSGPIGSADKSSNPLPLPSEVPAAADGSEKTVSMGGVQTLSPVKDGLDPTATIPESPDNGAARGVQTLAPVNDGVIRESTPDSATVPQKPSERIAEAEEPSAASPTDGLSILPANSGSSDASVQPPN